MNESIPELKIELMDYGKDGSLILLEQDCGGEIERVSIHPIHLLYMVKNFGLSDASDVRMQEAISRLKRRLHLLSVRISHLATYLANSKEHQSTEPSYASVYAQATADIAKEFNADLNEL